MIRIFSVLILFISNSFADIQIRKQNDLFCYDGDTCYVIYEGKKDKIRLLDLDTPEISNPKCENEYILGIEAREYINQLISEGKRSGIFPVIKRACMNTDHFLFVDIV